MQCSPVEQRYSLSILNSSNCSHHNCPIKFSCNTPTLLTSSNKKEVKGFFLAISIYLLLLFNHAASQAVHPVMAQPPSKLRLPRRPTEEEEEKNLLQTC